MEHLPRRLAVIALAILFTLAFGTVGFVMIEGYPVFDAFYMTLTTVTTVGYGEIRALSHAGRIFNSFLISFGVVTIFLAVGAMTQTVDRTGAESIFRKATGQKHDRETGGALHRVRLRAAGARGGR